MSGKANSERRVASGESTPNHSLFAIGYSPLATRHSPGAALASLHRPSAAADDPDHLRDHRWSPLRSSNSCQAVRSSAQIAQLQGNDQGSTAISAVASGGGSAERPWRRRAVTFPRAKPRRAGARSQISSRSSRNSTASTAGVGAVFWIWCATIRRSTSAKAITAARRSSNSSRTEFRSRCRWGLWMMVDLLRDLHSAGDSQGGHRTVRVSMSGNLGGGDLRLRDPELPVRDPAGGAVLWRLVLAAVSAARPDLGHFADFSWPHKILDYLWHITLPVTALVLGAFATSTS